MTYLDALLGKRIRAAYTTPDKTLIVFDCGDSKLAYYTDGECCSESWIEHIEGTEAIRDATVNAIEERDDWVDGSDDRDDCVTVYATAIRTDKGVCVIEYRNASNGYYGGSLEPTMDHSADLEITEDF